MSLTPSEMIPLGTKAPDFELPDAVSGKNISLSDAKSDKGTVIMFICNHCPYVQHIQDEIVSVAKHYQQQGIGFVAISSNDAVNYPDDAPDLMKEFAEESNFTFPYLYDESQEIAKAYQAACTPDIYVFDNELKCVYRGQLDGSRPGNDVPNDGHDLRAAIDNVIAGTPVSDDQKPSMGCNIKWK